MIVEDREKVDMPNMDVNDDEVIDDDCKGDKKILRRRKRDKKFFVFPKEEKDMCKNPDYFYFKLFNYDPQ